MGKRIGKLGLVNYIDHPTSSQHTVFNFNTKIEADLFAKKLTEENVWFEKDEEEHEKETLYLFAVENKQLEKAKRANFYVSGETRKNIIPNAFLRYGLIFFFFGVLILAIIGYVKNS